MRQRLKLILFAALSAALTVAGLSIAAGGGSSDSNTDDRRSTRDVDRHFGPRGLAMRVDEDVAEVMRQIHEAVHEKTPEFADPIIQKAEDAGEITADQADKLRALVRAEGDRKRPSEALRALFRDADVRTVLKDVFEAKHEQTPAIAEPIIDKAVDEKKITSAQADDLREQLKNGPGKRFGHGHGPGHSGKFGSFDQDVGEVVHDIHEAVEKKAPAIAGPVIQKAEDAGDITSAQADQLREAAQAIANGKRPSADLRSLLADTDVRKVVRNAFAAAGKQVPAIAEPIIDKAVDEKKITSAQADDIRAKLKRVRSLRIGPPHLGGPGKRHHGMPGQFERRPGNAPGVFPGDVEPAPQPAESLSPA